MAPHIEKAQLISKPTRRSCSKSPSKPGKENEEMPKQLQEQATPPRKISDEFLKVIVPGRKISAPELNRPPVKKGGRRNLFMERCISQEEKENIKTKPPMRKFSTPAIPSISKTNVDENDNTTAKVEAPKTILPVYEVCTKPRNNNNNQSCQITQPKVEENAPVPVNRRYSRPASIIEDIDTEKLIKGGEEDKKSRRISVPMFHISQEGSSNNNTGSRKLYTERCISTEEKENIKSKPIAKKPPKEKPPNTTIDINDHDSDLTKDSKATKDTTEAKETKEVSNGKKLLEKVKLKPKSAQRKLSAPAKMMTPPPITSPAVNGHDLLSSGIVLDGRGGGVGIDATLPLRREEDGKPSFANAAKVVHAKVQVNLYLKQEFCNMYSKLNSYHLFKSLIPYNLF